MYERILRRMRARIHARQYAMTLHAAEEMDDDELTIFDVERVILTGAIIERQEDHVTGEWKYLVAGRSIDGDRVELAAKTSVMDKLVIITVYREG